LGSCKRAATTGVHPGRGALDDVAVIGYLRYDRTERTLRPLLILAAALTVGAASTPARGRPSAHGRPGTDLAVWVLSPSTM